MTITLYRVQKSVPDILSDFETAEQEPLSYARWVNMKVFNVFSMFYDGYELRLDTMDVRTGKCSTASVDSRLFTYFDVV